MKAIMDPDQRSWIEPAQVQCVDVELARDVRVCGQQDLEAAVEPEAVHQIGSHPPADAVGCLGHDDLTARVGECVRRRQAG